MQQAGKSAQIFPEAALGKLGSWVPALGTNAVRASAPSRSEPQQSQASSASTMPSPTASQIRLERMRGARTAVRVAAREGWWRDEARASSPWASGTTEAAGMAPPSAAESRPGLARGQAPTASVPPRVPAITAEELGDDPFMAEQGRRLLTPRNRGDAAELLGLKPGYSQMDVRAAYVSAAMRWHPDRPAWVQAKEEHRARAPAAFRRARAAHDLLVATSG